MDEKLYPATELILLYHERWEEELVFDEQKTHQDPRRATKPAHLRSETPPGVIQEFYALSLGHFVVRALMFEAAATEGLDPDRAVVHGLFSDPAMPLAGMRRPDACSRSRRGIAVALGDADGAYRTARNRINPRVIKRKMSKWKKKRPEHRHLAAVEENLCETVVMLR